MPAPRKDRMDITGARWGLDGAEAVLKLRALTANGDFDRYWHFHLRKEHERVHSVRYRESVILARVISSLQKSRTQLRPLMPCRNPLRWTRRDEDFRCLRRLCHRVPRENGRPVHGRQVPATGSSPQPSPVPKEPSVSQAEQQFHRAMVAIYETAKRDLGYNATRFLQMISEQGGLATARQLLWSDQPSDGFTTLWSHHRLDLTVEAHVLRPDYATLFTEADREQARRRLELYGWRERPGDAT